MKQGDVTPKADLHLKRWIVLTLVAAILTVILLVILLVATCLAKQKNISLVQSNMDSLHSRLIDRTNILLHVNESAFALANALRISNISSFAEVEEKIAPRLFTAFTTIQLVSHVSYISKDGLVFSYHQENRTNMFLSFKFSSCHVYNQNIDQYSGERRGYPVALSYDQCPAAKRWFLDALNEQVGSAKIRNQTIFFTAAVGNFGVVSIGVDLKSFLRHVSAVELDQRNFFLTIYSSSTNQSSSTNGSSTQIQIPRVPMVITLTFKDEKTMKVFQVLKVVVICLAGIVLLGMTLFIFYVLQSIKQSKIEVTVLNDELIKQTEAVKQAERKSMNKSMVVARASHDVRNALYSIMGLIDICQDQTPGSNLETDLAKIKDYTQDLLDLLNSILDYSKVESGKMHLEQAEFNISQIIEKSVDSFNVLAEKKGLEMIWDPCDFSVLKLGKVIGDKQRFKQILDNLLGNAVKFTSEGKIIVRAWANTPNLKMSNVFYDCGIISIYQMVCCMKRNVLRNLRSKNKQQDVNYIQNDPDSIELTFEVDDSGIGIPFEKRASVFENYVQLKEDSPEGTGLGLGIVQSFVRLMGGEINIIDKQPGENGTCFKFNILLKSGKTALQETVLNKEANQSTIADPCMLIESHSRKVHSLLFVKGSETKKILQTWIESLGIKVWTSKQAEQISSTLEKIKHNINSSSKSDSILVCKTFSRKFDKVGNEWFLHNLDKNSEPLPRVELSSELPLKVLIIVDLSSGNLPEILSTLIDFTRTNIKLYCRIVCIADSKVSENDLSQFRGLPCDLTLRKPIHGSRLQKLFKLIQELERDRELFVDRVPTMSFTESPMHKQPTEKQPKQLGEITEESSSKIESRFPLSGRHVLLVEDDKIVRMVACNTLRKLGAEVKVAENGYEALDMVKAALKTGLTRGKNDNFSSAFDAIFMDCKMPVMDGYEAARQIRKEERQYGVHIPICALTADGSNEDFQKASAAGMDDLILKDELLIKAADFVKPVST